MAETVIKDYLNKEGIGEYDKLIKQEIKSKVQGLADGQVKTNTDAIASLTTEVEKKAAKATTLAGYGIEDAYTKTETDSAITTAVANADHLKRSIVDALPDVADADANTIYMVAKSGGSGEQQYDEYMLINGAFEKIGDSAVDLTDYATKTYADTAAQTAETNAKSYADGLASNYATAEQGTKADSALQKADIAEGATNGTIKVKGDDVKVHGLGSAAYEADTAFDKAGVAATEAGKVLGTAADTKDANTVYGAKAYADGKVTDLANGQVATNTASITSLNEKVDAFTPIPLSYIQGLFSTTQE